jgi:hypothetical protein
LINYCGLDLIFNVIVRTKSSEQEQMQRFNGEEKAGLLLTSPDDDNDDDDGGDHRDERVSTTRRSSGGRDNNGLRTASTRTKATRHAQHPVLLFVVMLGVFTLGCLTGVVILLYRISQETPSTFDATHSVKVDGTIQTKLFRSMSNENFLVNNR